MLLRERIALEIFKGLDPSDYDEYEEVADHAVYMADLLIKSLAKPTSSLTRDEDEEDSSVQISESSEDNKKKKGLFGF